MGYTPIESALFYFFVNIQLYFQQIPTLFWKIFHVNWQILNNKFIILFLWNAEFSPHKVKNATFFVKK